MDYVAKTMIVGAGEVGKSLYTVLKDYHDTYIRDVQPIEIEGGVEILNICFPYQKGFEIAVKMYQDEYKPLVTIIHSSVPIGTSRKLNACHSPIHGKHPNLSNGIRTFVKYLGGADPTQLEIAEDFLKKAQINVMVVPTPEDSEHSKLACTRRYGISIVEMKELKKECDANGTNFDVVYGWNQFYNDGYRKLGMGHFTRPMLEYNEGKIGGHCVVPNCHLLDGPLSDFILEKDESY